jgi:hypothetical protein
LIPAYHVDFPTGIKANTVGNLKRPVVGKESRVVLRFGARDSISILSNTSVD